MEERGNLSDHSLKLRDRRIGTVTGVQDIKSFDDKDSAFKIARAWANELNETFCGEHEFAVTEVDDNYVISVD